MSARHPSWGNFEEYFIRPWKPAVLSIAGSPRIEFYFDPGSPRLGMRIACAARHIDTPFEHIDIHEETWRGQRFLAISSNEYRLFEMMYAFMMRVSDLIQLDDQEPPQAVSQSAEEFRRLLSSSEVLSREAAIGLWGELYLLRNRIRNCGCEVLKEWTGPRKEDHDFRGEYGELEVKSTSISERRHVISSLKQLAPSPGRKLYLASLQIGEAGNGKSVLDLVASIRVELRQSPGCVSEFEALLSGLGFPFPNSRQALVNYQLRAPVLFFEVDESIPAVTGVSLERALGPDRSSRVDDVSYRINLEGLDPVCDLPFAISMTEGDFR